MCVHCVHLSTLCLYIIVLQFQQFQKIQAFIPIYDQYGYMGIQEYAWFKKSDWMYRCTIKMYTNVHPYHFPGKIISQQYNSTIVQQYQFSKSLCCPIHISKSLFISYRDARFFVKGETRFFVILNNKTERRRGE